MNLRQARVVDPILTTVSLAYKNAEHIGHNLFPRVGVGVRGGQIIKFGKEAFRRYNARRAPGAGIQRVEFGYGAESFGLVQDALEGKVPVEHLEDAKAVPGVDLGTRAVNVVLSSLSLGLEWEQAQLATNAGLYDNNHKVALAGTDKWSDPASDPVSDVEDYKEAVRTTIGVYPNVLVLSAKAFKALKTHPKILDRFKFTAGDKTVTAEMLATLFDLEKVVVGKAVTTDATDALIDVWGNNAILAYVPTQTQIEVPSYGYTYTLNNNPLVETAYYDANARSWIYPVIYERAPLLTSITAGFLIQNPA